MTYNHEGMPTAITAGNSLVAGETRAYNTLGQSTQIVSGAYRFDYNFSATANDGRITSQTAFLNGGAPGQTSTASAFGFLTVRKSRDQQE